ncbi:SDR family oxidoreductase [Deinococcus kurensis]|uniref:SDR family oxidoreductase n=1 Tax=Deinococcus kurensis TaxID=2662757 RepID=UPI0012D2AE7A|nr:SDR family oxidoreductase [Deinococcus kurensis]
MSDQKSSDQQPEQSGPITPSANQFGMQDPRAQYPAPPFPRQPQEAPGTVGAMQPRPDHGEESYVGFGRLRGRRALITGADSGIGRAAAIAFAREGADVALNYLPDEEGDAREVVALIEAAGRRAVAIPGDLKDEAFCRDLVQRAVKELGGLDILVNNAGKQVSQESIEDITTEQFDETFRTNVYAMFWITQEAARHLGPGASIINTSSIQAYRPSPNLLDYASTKAAIVAFTQALAQQLGPRGIRVNAVAPGPFWTPLQPSGGQPQEKVQEFGASTPLGRPGQPAELAPLYVFLASQESSYSSGGTFGATGGQVLF